MLLHLLTLGNGPEPISPMLLYLLLAGASLKGNRGLCPTDSQIDLETLYKLDGGIAGALRPWMLLKESDQLSGFVGLPEPMVPMQFLLNQCNFQVCASL